MPTPKSFMPVVVGITGYARAGKDSIGDIFESLGYSRRAFADPLRALAYDLNPMLEFWSSTLKEEGTRYQHYLSQLGYEAAKSVPEFRNFLKDLGNGARKHLGADVWVRACLDEAPALTVVTDVRFLNEADAVRRRAGELGGNSLLLRVERPGVGPESEFEKEVPQIEVDFVVKNRGTLTDLRSCVLDLTGEFMVRTADRQGAPVLSRTKRAPETPEASKRSRFFPTLPFGDAA